MSLDPLAQKHWSWQDNIRFSLTIFPPASLALEREGRARAVAGSCGGGCGGESLRELVQGAVGCGGGHAKRERRAGAETVVGACMGDGRAGSALGRATDAF